MGPLGIKFGAVLLTTLGITSTALADTRNYNPTGQGCLDPKGFLSCYQKAVDQSTSCASICNGANPQGSQALRTCLVGCNGAQLAGNIGCWVQSCWNQLYSCEHQLAVISYFSGTDLIQQSNLFPWYPPPPGATDGACSCNLGYVYGNKTILAATPGFNDACFNVAKQGNPAALYTCQCCEFSFPLSNILNACPNSDLSILGMAAYLADQQRLVGNSEDNCAILEDGVQDTCLNTYGYRFRGDKVFNPLNLPSGIPGSEPLTNNPGNAFTDFGSPAFTLSLFPGYVSTVTPVPFNTKAGAATAAISGTAVATGTGAIITASGGTTNTATGAAATTSKPSGARRNIASNLFGLGMAALVISVL